MFGETWIDQYARMLRALTRLEGYCAGTIEVIDGDDPRDALYNFFMQAWNLAYWLEAEGVVKDAREVSKKVPVLAVCRDISDGAKHLHLTGGTDLPATTSTTRAKAANQGATIDMGRAAISYDWTITTDSGTSWPARELAHDVAAEWDTWLASKNLVLPS